MHVCILAQGCIQDFLFGGGGGAPIIHGWRDEFEGSVQSTQAITHSKLRKCLDSKIKC